METIDETLTTLNQQLKLLGFKFELILVNPKDCLEQKKNARYFKPEKFQQLVNNITNDGFLASTPLLRKEGDKFRIIDGTRRVTGAKAAGLDKILAFQYEPESEDEAISKQLAFNALVGEDDKVILAELFQSIKNIDFKIATGLNSEIAKIDYVSLNFRIGEFKELTMMFMPENLEDFDKDMEYTAEHSLVKSSTTLRLANLSQYEKFANAIRKIKKIENIKNNAVSISALIELTKDKLAEMEKDFEQGKQEKQDAKPDKKKNKKGVK